MWNFSLPAQEAPQQSKSVCISCHLETGEKRLMAPVKALQQKEEGNLVDVHARAGLSCQDCHGGDPTNEDTAKDKDKGYIGKPTPRQIPALCGRCHSDIEYMKRFNPRLPTDQLREYWTSVHGKRLLKEKDTRVATCVSCHGHHGVRSVQDPASPVYPTHVPETCGRCHADAAYMKPYGIPTNQLEGYKQSKHGKLLLEEGDLSAPRCNTCHGNHGATPPGVASVPRICGQCHAQQNEYFEQSTHAGVFQEKKLPGCVVCHSNHKILHPSDEMLNNQPRSVCRKCHQVNDPCYVAVGQMKKGMDGLTQNLDRTRELLKKAERLGMGVEKAQFSLNEVTDHLIKSRVEVHQFNKKIVEGELKKGQDLVTKAADQGQKALQEWQFRRKGLAASLVLILLTIGALLFKIRGSER